MKKGVRVWSADRSQRFGIVASDLNELLEKCLIKFELPDPTRVRFVLEEDGTEIDEAFFSTVAPHTRLILLNDGEIWHPPMLPFPIKCTAKPTAPASPPKVVINNEDMTDGEIEVSETKRAEQLFAELFTNPASIALLELSDIEVIKDADVYSLVTTINRDWALQVQELCTSYYIQKKSEHDALEFINLLKDKSIKIETEAEAVEYFSNLKGKPLKK